MNLADLFWNLVTTVGLPFALVVLALLTGRAGIWVWGREVEYERQQCIERLQELRREREDVVKDRDYYRDRLFRALERGEDAVGKAEQAVEIIERRRPR